AALLDLARTEPGAVWIPVTDATLALVDAVRSQLTGIELPIPESSALESSWDKGRLIDIARGAGFQVPRTWTPADAQAVARLAPELAYPVVLKPRRSRLKVAGRIESGTVRYVHSPAELVQAWSAAHARIPMPLVQERITGFGMGLFLLAAEGRILAAFAHRRRREKPPAGGVSVLSESIAVPADLIDPATRLLAALAWTGVCMLEFKVGDGDGTPRLMELNPRFWGSLALPLYAGVDFPWLLYQLASGRPPAPPAPYRVGVRSRWELGDLDHLLIRLAGRTERDLGPTAPTRLGALLRFLNPLAGRPEVLWLSDPAPFAHELRSYLAALRQPRRAAIAPERA
ncbi:MAG TPA: ATP-grasp domain-containing protein, partial [Candidatus Udaeobacter sp.]|nr:ATP-grasp domain-containing protein [Candidatus Udaeobacter sp.]